MLTECHPTFGVGVTWLRLVRLQLPVWAWIRARHPVSRQWLPRVEPGAARAANLLVVRTATGVTCAGGGIVGRPAHLSSLRWPSMFRAVGDSGMTDRCLRAMPQRG